MGVYRTVCYKVEDAFIKVIAKNSDPNEVNNKVLTYRQDKEEQRRTKKQEAQARAIERKKQQEMKKEKEHQEVKSLLTKLVDLEHTGYTNYEYDEVRKNSVFFRKLLSHIFDKDERGLTFIQCEFDKTKNKEIKGYLIATNYRVWFVSKDLEFSQKLRYQTIKEVRPFKDSLLEKGLFIQYGTKKLEFDEIFDKEQFRKLIEVLNKQLTQFQ
ncbi:GRAM domain-containing protein [Pontibacillus salicampi]|uniref:GRAM domain-containing protein n=1 Tax=Pontibacillus salicampi TaxID=1449801 RepID=A0ABV6LNB8_9BACI